MAFVFSRGVVGWILTIIMLLSALKHFRRPTPAPKIEKLDENVRPDLHNYLIPATYTYRGISSQTKICCFFL